MIDEPEAPHHHAHSGIKWLDLALAIAVLALSAASLITARHTGHTMEQLVEENSRLVRANATPLLQFGTGNVTGPNQREITLTVSNVGTGTARVIWLEVAKAGKPARFARELIGYQPRAAEQDYVPSQTVGGTYLPAGENRTILSWRYPSSAAAQSKWQAFDDARYGLTATACFCSVLGECWTSNLRADMPNPVKACDARGRSNFVGPG